MEWARIKPSVEKIVGEEGSSSKLWLKTSNEQTKIHWNALTPDERRKYYDMAKDINSGEASDELKAQ